MKEKKISDIEAVKNLLIINLLKDNVDPQVIAYATGIPEGTIRRKFQMKSIKNSEKVKQDAKKD